MADSADLVRSQTLVDVGYLHITRDTIRFPDNTEVDRAVVWHPGAVALVVEDADGRWLMVEQYRHPAGQVLLEIPAGTREAGEHPDATAAREVREETGYAAGRLLRLGGAWMAPGFCSEYIHYYLATDLRHDPLPQDHDEFIDEPRRLTLEEVRTAVASGKIEDSKTLIALTLYDQYQRRASI
ncbi:MAG: NUDIX hydrolase [Dehalococcoidia bacterium]|nr:MAG: NUDIX hydrolase [Dehalococcoidia bacterium]